MDGATVTPVAARSKSSGNAKTFEDTNSATGIRTIQHSPLTIGKNAKSDHLGEYYKITYTDGSKVKIVDPSGYSPSFEGPNRPIYDKNTTYLNPKGGSGKI